MSWTRRLPSGKVQGNARGPDGKVHTQTWPNLKAAREWAAETELELRLGKRAASRMTVGEWEPQWWPQWTVEASTRATAAGRMKTYVRPEWKDVPLADITTFRVQRWAHRLLAEGTGRETVRGAVRLLSSLCAGAVQADLLPANPCAGVKLPPAVKRMPRYLEEAEVDKLAAVLPKPHKQMVLIAAFTGLRWGELAGLHWHRVDLPARRLHVVETLQEVSGRISVKAYPKSSRAWRTVPLAARAVDAFTELGEGTGRGLVFATATGEPLSRSNTFNRVWTPALVTVGLADPQPRWHDLRHTCASWLVQAGVPIYEVQRVLGHSSVTVTERYSHLAKDSYDRVLEAFDGPPPRAPRKRRRTTPGRPRPRQP